MIQENDSLSLLKKSHLSQFMYVRHYNVLYTSSYMHLSSVERALHILMTVFSNLFFVALLLLKDSYAENLLGNNKEKEDEETDN